jgi:hypothetical protein
MLVGLSLWWKRRDLRGVAALVLSAAIVLLSIGPWLLHNLAVYGTPTANARAKTMQQHIVNPTEAAFTMEDVWRGLPRVVHFQAPQEAGTFDPGAVGSLLIGTLIILPPLVGYRSYQRRYLLRTAVLASALPAGVAALAVLAMYEDLALMLPRYLIAALPAYGMFAFLAYQEALPALALRAIMVGCLVANVVLWTDFTRAVLL